MTNPDVSNQEFQLALDLINNTSQHIFLTGKAGTGKTTFLKYFREHSDKKVLVAAPTGVAAINAGGVTLHSLFQLSFEPYIPGAGYSKNTTHFRMTKQKIDLLRSFDVLVIDEISMVRADLLDAVDASLRRYRNSMQPFGGVQMLYIGDVFQLPPVAKEEEWSLLSPYYQSQFFFHSKAWEKATPLYIELKKIYRQKEQKFIDLLNKVRLGNLNSDDIAALNERFRQNFRPSDSERYIILSTHNYRVDRINAQKLQELPAKKFCFRGDITGEFSDNSLPTEMVLELKKGAQVIFIKNDTGQDRKYYNGMLGVISEISDKEIKVQPIDAAFAALTVTRETWKNIRYSLNRETNAVSEEELGAFTQYPIRLAWAITIHKSQGLTFDRAIIDAGQAFAPGQVYVALSRCTTLEGLVLQSRITPGSITVDDNVLTFSEKGDTVGRLQQVLKVEKPRFCAQKLLRVFNLQPLTSAARKFMDLTLAKKIPEVEKAQQLSMQIYQKAKSLKEVADKFIPVLNRLLDDAQKTGSPQGLQQRVPKAASYFYLNIYDEILLPLQLHAAEVKKAARVKEYLKELVEVEMDILFVLSKVQIIKYDSICLVNIDPPKREVKVEPVSEKHKPVKGDSAKITLEMFGKEQTIAQIAAARSIAESTVESHLAQMVELGELDIHRWLSNEQISAIEEGIKKVEDKNVAQIFVALNRQYSYGAIRGVLAHQSAKK
jgi:cytochrome c556